MDRQTKMLGNRRALKENTCNWPKCRVVLKKHQLKVKSGNLKLKLLCRRHYRLRENLMNRGIVPHIKDISTQNNTTLDVLHEKSEQHHTNDQIALI
jgi:hypothetical protein